MTWFAVDRPLPKLAAQGTSFAISRGALLTATVLVARYAGVGEYGTFALGLVVFQAGLFLRDAGLGQALIVLGGEHAGLLWPAFIVTTLVGLLVALLMFLGADAITGLLRMPAAGRDLRILALAFGVGSLGVASMASLERSLRFGARAVIDVTAYLGLLGVTAIGLTAGWGAEALAWGYVAQGACQALLGILLVQPWRDRRAVPIAAFLRYGGLLWLAALLAYLATNVDNASVGVLGGATSLGIYAFAYSVGSTVTISLAQVISRVALPYVSRDHLDTVAIARSVTVLVPLAVWASLAPAALIVAFAPEIMRIVEPGGTATFVLVLLAVYGVARSFGIISGTVLTGLRLARVALVAGVVNVGIMAVAVPPGFVVGGPAGAAAAVLLACVVSVLVQSRHLVRRGLLDRRRAAGPVLVLVLVVLPVALPGGPALVVVRAVAALTAVAVSGGACWRLAFGKPAPAVGVG